MTALTHAVVVSLSDNPAYEVSKNAWNQAHPLPGNANEIFFSDGAQGIATSAELAFDAGSNRLTVGASGLGGISGGVAGLQLISEPAFGASLYLGADGTVGLTGGGGSVSVGAAEISVSAPSGTSVTCRNEEPYYVGWYGGPLIPQGDNAYDIGGLTATLGGDFRIRTGYFGTSVVVGATPFTFSETAGVLQLGSADLTFDAVAHALVLGTAMQEVGLYSGGTGFSLASTSSEEFTVVLNADGSGGLSNNLGAFVSLVGDGSVTIDDVGGLGGLLLNGTGGTRLGPTGSQLDLGNLDVGEVVLTGSAKVTLNGEFSQLILDTNGVSLLTGSGTWLIDAATGTLSSEFNEIDVAGYKVGGVAGADGTVSGADLVAQSLSFVKGIYMGLV